MPVLREFNEGLHPRDKGKFTNKPQSAGTTVLAAPSGPAAGRTPIMATATLQAWEGDDAVTVGEVQFDASSILAGMTADQRAGLGEDAGDQDEIFEKAVSTGLIPRHEGPYEVDVREALDEALETNPAYFDERDPELNADEPAAADDFDRSLPQFEGWPESLAEPTMDFSINDDGTVGTKLKVAGQGELDFYSDSSGRAAHEHYAGNFEDINEEVLDQAVEWGYVKHLEIENSVRAEMKTAAAAARGRILAGAGMKGPSPTDEELGNLIQQTIPLRANAEQTGELASTALMARNILAAHPGATHAEILVEEGDGMEFVSGVSVLDANRELLEEYDYGSEMFGDAPLNSQAITGPLANLNPNSSNAHWERYTSLNNFGSVEEMQRDAYIIDLAQAAAWTPGT